MPAARRTASGSIKDRSSYRCLRWFCGVRSRRTITIKGAISMHLYAILRRSGWRSPEDLQQAAARSKRVGNDDMPDDIRWIRSYVLDEAGGSVGTVCIYEATSAEAIRRHASLADLPVDEIIAVADTVVVRPDPQPATA
jgi:hypothetical protein